MPRLLRAGVLVLAAQHLVETVHRTSEPRRQRDDRLFGLAAGGLDLPRPDGHGLERRAATRGRFIGHVHIGCGSKQSGMVHRINYNSRTNLSVVAVMVTADALLT